MVFVFGSNLAGVHGAGAAKYAYTHHGAKWGLGSGFVGNSYAIPTKDMRIKTLPLTTIKVFVNIFVKFAKKHPELTFALTPIGTGLAGYSKKEMWQLFEEEKIPSNVYLTSTWMNE